MIIVLEPDVGSEHSVERRLVRLLGRAGLEPAQARSLLDRWRAAQSGREAAGCPDRREREPNE